MTYKLAIIHTTAATIQPLREMAESHVPGIQIINYLDDSVLPQLMENGGSLKGVETRLIQYAKNAEKASAHIIFSACSSVGELVEKMRQAVSIPVVRIDDAMAEAAVTRGRHIGVIATLATTLEPSLRLLQQKAESKEGEYRFESVLADEAYKMLLSNNMEEHDRILADELMNLSKRTDIVVLAQASMARAVKRLPKREQSKFMTSIELGMISVKNTLDELY